MATPYNYTIDKNVELPEASQGGGKPTYKYPWRNMEIGDSFLFPEGFSQKKASGVAAGPRRTLGMKFATRVIDGRVRIWRIA